MKLEISGIAKISDAKVELKGITVIAGENNTGKSTIGKVLFAMNDFMYGFDEYIEFDIKNAIRSEISSLGDYLDVLGKEYHTSNKQFRRKTVKVKTLCENYTQRIYEMFSNHNKNKLNSVLKQYTKEHLELYHVLYDIHEEEVVPRIEEVVASLYEVFDMNENELGTGSVTKSFEDVFNGQINNLGMSEACGEVVYTDDYGKSTTVRISEDACYYVDCNTPVRNPAIFIENPRIVDRVNARVRTHYSDQYTNKSMSEIRRERLRRALSPSNNFYFGKCTRKIYVEEMSEAKITITQKKLKRVKELIYEAVPGEYTTENGELHYREPGMAKAIKLQNLSTGLKAMVLLDQIISVGLLNEKTTLILDEPEINLHPEWQLLYAEIIVLLQEIYDLNIIITTHSPYFLKAIEGFVKKENRQENSKYYLTEVVDGEFVISDMSDRMNILYRMLADPLRALKQME